MDLRPAPRKRWPFGAGSDEERVGDIRRILTDSPLHGEGYRKAWARLYYRGIRASEERLRRLMRLHDLQVLHRVSHPHGLKAHDVTILTGRPDELWGTDMTATVTTHEGETGLHRCRSLCWRVRGLHTSTHVNPFEAPEPIRQGVREHFGGSDWGIVARLTICHDHGSANTSEVFQRELAFLGMASSPNFVREPQGNVIAERFVKTLEEH